MSVAEAMPVCGERAALAGVVLEWCGKSAAAGAATQQCHTLLARTQNELGALLVGRGGVELSLPPLCC